jgi:NAD(P)-dependent dehydrogenase (short-subunit alcohol dehydrogenase family)
VDRNGEPFDLEAFQRVIDINLVGTFNMFSRAAAAMSNTVLPGLIDKPIDGGVRLPPK